MRSQFLIHIGYALHALLESVGSIYWLRAEGSHITTQVGRLLRTTNLSFVSVGMHGNAVVVVVCFGDLDD